MSVHTHRVFTPEALTRALPQLSLVFDASGEYCWDYRPHLRPGEVDPTPPGRQVGALRLDPPGPVCGFNRGPAVVGVFELTAPGGEELLGFTLAWDDFKDGWGLGARLGTGGRHLKMAIALAETELAAERLGLERALHADADGRCRVTLRRQGDGTVQKQPEVVIDIDPTGKVVIEVNGAQGTSCEGLTKAIEDALGTVETHDRKPEYYKPVTQTATVGVKATGG